MEQYPALYLDVASPEAYLAAERALQVLPVATEWIGVLARDLDPGAPPAAIDREQVERTATERGLQPLHWPDPLPFDSALAMTAAAYARQTGRMVAFTLAAFRQAYAAGRSLDEPDNVLIAASACEMHPAAVLKACATRTVRDVLARETALAAARGVRRVPAVWVPPAAGDTDPGQVFHGDDGLAQAAAALARAAA